MKLSNRLYACAGLVRPGSHAADIGTDHGYLPIYLISNGICESVVAADLRPMPLQAAKNNAEQAGLSDRITFCLSDGLRSVPLEGIDTVICAGMGGDTIQSILQGTPDIWRPGVQFILQPQAAVPELRGFLSEHGFQIAQEVFAQDGKFVYTVMEVYYGDGTTIPSERRYIPQGVKDRSDPLYLAYMARICSGLEKTVNGLRCAAQADPKRLTYYTAALNAVKEEDANEDRT